MELGVRGLVSTALGPSRERLAPDRRRGRRGIVVEGDNLQNLRPAEWQGGRNGKASLPLPPAGKLNEELG